MRPSHQVPFPLFSGRSGGWGWGTCFPRVVFEHWLMETSAFKPSQCVYSSPSPAEQPIVSGRQQERTAGPALSPWSWRYSSSSSFCGRPARRPSLTSPVRKLFPQYIFVYLSSFFWEDEAIGSHQTDHVVQHSKSTPHNLWWPRQSQSKTCSVTAYANVRSWL